MVNESTQISDDLLPVEGSESLMRRILKRLVEYDREKSPPIQIAAFLPTKRDIGGLSLNRRMSDQHKIFLTPESLKNWHEVPENIRETCGVVAIIASVAREIGLTVKTDLATTPGHVLIEEINWNDFAGDRRTDESHDKILGWALQLTRNAVVLIAPGKSKNDLSSRTV